MLTGMIWSIGQHEDAFAVSVFILFFIFSQSLSKAGSPMNLI